MGPLIGIPPCLDERGRWRRGRSYHYLDCAYADAVAEAGGTPVYLPQQDDPSALAGRLDGLLLPGGGDFPPPRPYPDGVDFDREAELAIDLIEEHGQGDVPVCMAKTQKSLSDSARLRGRPKGFRVRVNEVVLSAGAGFVVAICGKMMTMPGLPKEPTAVRIRVDDEGRVTGLS